MFKNSVLLSHMKTVIRLCLFFLLAQLPVRILADAYDPQNYPPKVDTLSIGRTNLPIVFIDTRCAADTTKAIHYDYRVSARMKIVSNADGVNYGDTVAHPDQTADYEGWAAIRYRGNTSFSWSDKKPYNFKTMKGDDPEGEKLNTGLLGMPKDHTWVLLAPYIDSSLLRDVLVFELARPWMDYTPRCRYCELVVDGTYYGIYILAENIRKGKNRLDLDDPGLSGDELTGGYLLQIDRDDEPHFTSAYLATDSLGRTFRTHNKIFFQYKHPDYEDLMPQQAEYIEHSVRRMEDALAADDFADPETGYRRYLDPTSFIDYQLSQEFAGNLDAYRLSTNIYKHRDSHDPRFKTALWDFDLAFGNTSTANARGTDFWRYQNSYLTSQNAYNKVPFWWMRLMQDPAYVKQLKERWAQYREQNYSLRRIEATIDSITTLLRQEGALERNNTAWKMFSKSTYDMEIERLKAWIASRVAWMDEQLDCDANSIVTIPADAPLRKEITAFYALSGVRLAAPPQHGIFIVACKDGTVRKITKK